MPNWSGHGGGRGGRFQYASYTIPVNGDDFGDGYGSELRREQNKKIDSEIRVSKKDNFFAEEVKPADKAVKDDECGCKIL